MNKKPIPSPPTLPPTIIIPKNFCLFHKGQISSPVYTCPKCKTQYCLECAKKSKAEGISCVK
ncbi:MAG: hypothetical protein ACFFKA_15440, partial [Candidatus Thorarchaeota archaeon]